MAVVKLSTSQSTSYNKVADTHYVYEVTYYYDEETKDKFKKRRVIGKIDPRTGETVPTGSAAKKAIKENSEQKDYESLYKKAIKQYDRQFELDRNAKAQLASALKTASERLEAVISTVKQEKANIDRLLRIYGTQGKQES